VALPKDGCPLVACGGISPTHNYYKTTVHQMVITHKKNWLLALPCQSPGRENQQGKWQDSCREEQCLFFYVFLSLKEVQTSPWCELFKISIDSCFCRWMVGTIPSLNTTRGSELCVRLTVSGHKVRWDPELSGFRTTIKQSKTWSWDGWRLLHLCALYVVPWWTHAQLVHFRFDVPLSSTSTPYHLRFQL